MAEQFEPRERQESTVPQVAADGGHAPVQTHRRKPSRALIVVIALIFTVAAFAAGWFGRYYAIDSHARSFLWMLDAVQKNYREKVDMDELYDKLYDALELDRFCAHYTPEEYADIVAESKGRNTGYGFSYVEEGERVRLYRVVGNSPAELSGMKKGMYIFRCNGAEITSSGELAEALAEGDTAVFECGFSEDGDDKASYEVTRSSYLASYCRYADSENTFVFRGTKQLVLTEAGAGIAELPADTAYLSLAEFDGNAAWEVKTCLQKMKERGRTNLVLDLRSNGGGYLSTLCEISAHFMRNAKAHNPLVTSVRYRSGKTLKYRATGNDFGSYFNADSRISVLADENSASASECLLGVLVDYGTVSYSDIYLRQDDKGVARTYGKGVMQAHFTAPDGNVMRLTVADVFWPKGNNIHEVGVTKADGAIGIKADRIWGARDEMLLEVCSRLA